jgi:steroid delta-isomerase-like uncharacterized protein
MTRRELVLRGLGPVVVGTSGVVSLGAVPSTQRLQRVDLDANKALVRRWVEEGFNRRDLNVIDAIFAEDFAVNKSAIGRRGLKQGMTARFAAFPDLRVSIVEIIAEGDKVGIWYTAQGTQRGEFEGVRPTDKQASWFGSDFLRVEDGKIVEGWFVDDSLGLWRQLGIIPALSPTPR